MGENCEHLWALLRALLKQTRYMTKDAYIFCLDDALLLVAEDKLQDFVEFMTQQQAATEQKLGKYFIRQWMADGDGDGSAGVCSDGIQGLQPGGGL